MAYRITLIAAIISVFAAGLLAQRSASTPQRFGAAPAQPCRRIVSMAPSLTETLYAIGLGDRVAGVTSHCEYPPEATNKPRVGGYLDPNFEAVLSLRPDLIVLLKEQASAAAKFESLGLTTLTVDHQTIDGMVESFRAIGRACGRDEAGCHMAAEFRRRLARVAEKTAGLSQPRVLLVLDRLYGSGRLSDLLIAADDDYFDTVVKLAGGRNACPQRGVRYPVVSSEGVLAMNPDIVIELAPEETLQRLGLKKLQEDWLALKTLGAVAHRRVLIFDKRYARVPGPRFIELVEHLARALHPEADWVEK